MVTDTRSRFGISNEQLAEFCTRNGISRLALFGSVLREDFSPESDIDVLVEFEPSRTPGLKFFSMESELSEMVGRKVDLNTAGFLSDRFRERVLREAEVLFELPGRQGTAATHVGPRRGSAPWHKAGNVATWMKIDN